ncbi:Heat shock protein 70 like protein [Termitomyces sp. J132]|nr:Heat shock protein 70 like protein [Termitomyces sp. J132]
MSSTPVPNGKAEAPTDRSSLPAVVGINFGNSYSSIAVFTKEGVAECIANEDGERQIASAISFSGEEIYIGNQATHQLVKNAKNTIVGFRNLLGKKFSEIPQSEAKKSAPIIQHPEIPDEPAYKVEVLQPAPAPLPQTRSTPASNLATPAASHTATPRSAEDFLGKKVEEAVITVPTAFSEVQKDALEKAATAAGVHVLQLLDEAAAAAVTTTSDIWAIELPSDRTQLIVDLGSSSLSLTLLSIRAGLAFVLASSYTTEIGADHIDDKLVKFFAADFTKKTKIHLSVCPSNGTADERAEARFRIAIEHTKRTISASPGAATCSVESLKDGMDYTGSINRMRFDLVVRSVYTAVASAVSALLESAQVDPHHVDEIVYVGGSTCLPGLDDTLQTTVGFRDDIETPFSRGIVVGGGVGDPTTVLARGCAVQGALLAAIPNDEQHNELRAAYERGSKSNQVQATSRTVGVLLPNGEDTELGGVWIPIVHKETALPARRVVRFDVQLAENEKKLAFEVWEVAESIRVEKVAPPAVDADEEDEEEPEELEVKHRVVKKKTFLGAIQAEAILGIQTNKDAGKWFTTVEVQFVIDVSGALSVDVKEVGEGGATGSLRVPSS